VTAAAQGIGEAITQAFAEAGADVLATDIAADKLAAYDEVGGVRTARLDATDGQAVESLVASEAPFDVLVNAAGVVFNGTVLECSVDDWDRTFELNVRSMFLVSRAVLPGMRQKGNGSIVNIGSICAHRGLPNRFAYSASKAAVVGLTKSIAADFVGEGIRCNVIHPGTVQSPSLEGRIAAYDDPVAARAAFVARQPMGRLGRPEEIAAMALYLASDESVFTSGAQMNVDGGMTI